MTARIVITIGQLTVGGAERRLLHLVQTIHQRRAPVAITLFVVSGKPGIFDDDFRSAGANIVFGRPGIRGLADLWSACRVVRPTVLHINAETAAGFYAFAGLLAGVPGTVAHFRSMDTSRGGLARVKSWTYQIATNLFCRRIIGVSNGSRRGRLILRPWQTIYNGIQMPGDDELEAMPAPPRYHSSRLRVTVLGRIDRAKNVARAIRIFAALRSRRPTAELHIVGPFVTGSAEELMAVARSLDVADQVHCHGPTSAPLQYLAHSSVLLMTSRVEGLPGVVIEALACGTPVVCSDVPGAGEIAAATHGVTCLSLDDADDAWAVAIGSAFTLSRTAIRDAFRQSPFNTDRYVADILRIWNVAT